MPRNTASDANSSHLKEEEESHIPLIIIENASKEEPHYIGQRPGILHKNQQRGERGKLSPSFGMGDASLRRKSSNLRRHVSFSNNDEYMDTDDLKALVHTELPSSYRRRRTISDKDLEPESKFGRLAFATFGWFYKDKGDEGENRNSSGRESDDEDYLVADLADTIVNKDEVFVDDNDVRQAKPTFTERMHRMSTVIEEDVTLHSRLIRRASKRDYARLSEPFGTDIDVVEFYQFRDDADADSPLRARAAVSLSEGTVLPLQSSKWAKGFQDVSTSVSGVVSRLNLWSRQFKEIEGRFGIATATYFRFIRWLVKINFMVLFLFLCFIYIPQLSYTTIFDQNPFKDQNVSRSTDVMFRCSSSYNEHVENVSESGGWEVLLDIAQGTGILENTMLFYGFYSNLTFFLPDDTLEVRYNMGLGYLLTVGMCFLVVFIMIVKNSSRTIRDIVIDFDNKTFPVYTNAVFCGWDYCINTKNMAFFKQKILYTELKAALEEVESKRRRDGRTGREKARLYSKRFAVNLLVLALLGGSFYAIYVATDFLLEKQSEDLSDFVGLLINYLPSIVISVLNVIIPEIFLLLSEVEDYTQGFSTSITIIRAVFLRLASVGVLIVSLYYRLQQNRERETYACPEEYKFSANFTRCCGNTLWQTDLENDQTGKGSVKCWESYVGQQFYKLGLTDFFSAILLFLLIKIPRKLIYDQLKDKIGIIKKIGLSKFDLPLQVLDIVYSQTLCWMGMFFTPLMPVITFIKVFIFFFLRKLELRTVTESPENTYRASRSYSFFQIILLVSFIIVSGLLGYMIGNLQPSMSCGPFRLYSSPDFVMFDVISNEVASWPSVPRVIVQFFGTVAFFLPAFLILLLAIYYYWACASGYKKMEELLKEQLKSEAHDKQFLLARVDEVIKKGQLRNEDYR